MYCLEISMTKLKSFVETGDILPGWDIFSNFFAAKTQFLPIMSISSVFRLSQKAIPTRNKGKLALHQVTWGWCKFWLEIEVEKRVEEMKEKGEMGLYRTKYKRRMRKKKWGREATYLGYVTTNLDISCIPPPTARQASKPKPKRAYIV